MEYFLKTFFHIAARFLGVFCTLFFIFFALSSIAAPRSSENTAERMLKEERLKRERELFEKQSGSEARPIEIPERNTAEECIPISKIDFQGNTKLSANDLDILFSPHLQRGCVSATDIRSLLISITNLYMERGFITTRVYFKRTGFLDGTLTLFAVEGKIAKIEINPDEKDFFSFRNLLSEYTAFPRREGQVLNLKDIEQGIDQMQRLASVKAKARIEPGEIEGTTNIRIDKTSNDALRGSFSYDNYGGRETGEARYKAILEADDPLALNDSWFLSYIGSKNTNALAGSSSFPIGYWTNRFDYSYSEYLMSLDNGLDLFGSGYSASYTADRLLYRDKKNKLSAYGTLSKKQSRRIQNEFEFRPQPLTVARLGGKLFKRGNNFTLYSDAAFAQGLDLFDATKDDDFLSKEAPHAQFKKIDGTADFSLAIKPVGTFRTQAEWQYSFDTLYGAEQVSVGGPETVRGFSGDGITGDVGGSLRNSLYLAWPDAIKNQTILQSLTNPFSPYVFTDLGAARAQTMKHYDSIVGAGAGVSFSVGRFIGDISVSRPIYKSDDVLTENGVVVYISLLAKAF